MYRIRQELDIRLITVIVAIFLIGLIALFSASHQPNGTVLKNYAFQQIKWMALALCVGGLVMWIGYERFVDFGYILLFFNIVLLGVVFVIGSERLGAKRWIDIGLFNLQPSEICKISFILAIVKYASDNIHRMKRFSTVFGALILCGIPMLLIIKQPDLGTGMIFVPVLFIVLLAAEARMSHILSIIFTGILTMPVLWMLLKEYQKKRLIVFLNPGADPLGAGYTITQSKIAIGSGGVVGKGWMAGTQNQLNFLPERHTDFIFSVIGEEWGFIGAVVLLGLYVLMLRRLISIADSTNDYRGKFLVLSVASVLWFQVFINIAMTIGIMPVVGIPLPLISYGGSSLMTTAILLALAMSVGVRRKIF